jgi:hypothetical protein
MDWDKYAKEKKLEGELAKNRKDGFIAKKNFLDDVNDREYQHQKTIEKHQIANKK